MRQSLVLAAIVSTFVSCAVCRPASAAVLVHRYHFNDGTANDSVGAAHGVPVRGPLIQNGQITFDPAINNGTNTNPATGQYVDLPSDLANFRHVTVESWFTYRGGDNWQRVFDFGNNRERTDLTPGTPTPVPTFGEGFFMLTPENTQGRLIGQISIDSWGNPADTDFVVDGVLPTNVEQHVVFTHDPDAGVQRLYLNGVQVGQAVAEVDPSTTDYLNWWLGRSQFTQDPFFNGSINEFRIYQGALSAAEVAANGAAGPNGAIVPEPSAAAVIAAAAGMLLRLRRRAS